VKPFIVRRKRFFAGFGEQTISIDSKEEEGEKCHFE
jgi:hypothetical protein